jgi:hypothetical protein
MDNYSIKNQSKIGYLRIETISRILTLGNVFPTNNVLIVDTYMGMITASVMER